MLAIPNKNKHCFKKDQDNKIWEVILNKAPH